MNTPVYPPTLALEDTVEVARLRHRLALGLSWLDALTRQAVLGPLCAVVEAVGPYVLNQRMDMHRVDRHALRYAGMVQKRFDKALADAGAADWAVRVYGGRHPQVAYATDLDPRLYVPRRIRLAPALDGLMPAATPLNIRQPWLWPGSAYPLPGNATVIRGRLRRGPDPDHSVPIPWGRVIATVPAGQTQFNAATPVAYGHGDDRGEFLLVLDNRAVSGATLSNPLTVRLWPFLPPAGTVLDAADPLASLPLEMGGVDNSNAVLRGHAIPAGYLAAASRVVPLRLGETKSDGDTTMLFA